MHWDDDPFDRPPPYGACRIGFALCALGLALMSLDAVVYLASMFAGDQAALEAIRGPYWEWTVGVAITYGTLLGPLLLAGRFPDPAWRRQAGLLVVLNLADVGFWLARNGHKLGLWATEYRRHSWLRLHVLMGSSWVQFALFAALAAEVSAHLGSKTARDSESRAKGLATAGGLLWMLLFLHQTAWHRGWPLRPRGLDHLSFLMWTGLMLIRLVASFQVATLCLAACRECARATREHDPWNHQGHDLLRSRSELEDEALWKPPPVDDWFADPRGRDRERGL